MTTFPTGVIRMLPNTKRTTYLRPGLRSPGNEYHVELVEDRKPILGNCHPQRAEAIHSGSMRIAEDFIFSKSSSLSIPGASFELSVIDGGFRGGYFPF